MGWKDEEGPDGYNFVPIPNKWGYLNNPRWTRSQEPQANHNYDDNPEDEPQVWDADSHGDKDGADRHHACGHWHKGGGGRVTTPYVQANLYGLFIVGGALWGVFFDAYERSLTYVGKYYAGTTLNGLVLVGNSLYSIAGLDASAELRQVSLQPDGAGWLQLEATHDVFEDHDAEIHTIVHMRDFPELGHIYCPQGDTS